MRTQTHLPIAFIYGRRFVLLDRGASGGNGYQMSSIWPNQCPAIIFFNTTALLCSVSLAANTKVSVPSLWRR